MEGLEEGFQPGDDGEAVMVALEGKALAVFPCKANKRPSTQRGHEGHGFKDASADPALIKHWWGLWPWALIGVPTGAVNRIDILDIDLHKGGDVWFEENRHRIPVTRVHRTTHGGLHLLFQHAWGLRLSDNAIAKGVDVRADDSYAIWWPAHGCPVLSDAPLAPWPEWLLPLARAAMRKRDYSEIKNQNTKSISQVSIPKTGDRFVPDRLHRKIIELMRGGLPRHQRRVRGALRELAWAREGRRKELFSAAGQLHDLIGEGVITPNDARELLFVAATINGYVEKRGEDHVRATIEVGLNIPDTGDMDFCVFEKEEGTE
jgi:hypothetical protein